MLGVQGCHANSKVDKSLEFSRVPSGSRGDNDPGNNGGPVSSWTGRRSSLIQKIRVPGGNRNQGLEGGVPRLDGQEAEQRQTDPDLVKVSASKSEIRLPFRRLGEEGEEDPFRFFRTGEPVAEVAEKHGRAGITDATP